MSTVTLSKPHCAITSAENPEGIASQAFTAALPEAHTFLTLFATIFSFPFAQTHRHCEEPTGPASGGPDDKLRDEAIQSFASGFGLLRGACHRAALCADPLARNDAKLLHGPLYPRLAHADLARGIHYRRTDIVRQGHAVFGALGAHFCFRLARDQHGIEARSRPGILEIGDVARNLAIEEIAGIDHFGIDVDRE